LICRTRPDVFVFFTGSLTTTSCVYHNIGGEGRRERVVSDGPEALNHAVNGRLAAAGGVYVGSNGCSEMP
jgi:hypothetical protein